MNKISNIGLSRELTSCYDFQGFTEQEVWSRIAQKINIIIEHFNYLDTKIENEKTNNKAKFDYLLGEGLNESLSRIIIQKISDGTIGEFINGTLLKEINDKVDDFQQTFNKQLDDIVSMTNVLYAIAIINFNNCTGNYVTAKNMIVQGAKVGDFVQIATDKVHENIIFSGMITSENIVSVRVANISSSQVNLGDITCKVMVTRME